MSSLTVLTKRLPFSETVVITLKLLVMTVYLVKCKIDCSEEAKIRGIAPKIIKFESDVFGTEAQAQEFKQNFINKHQKKWGAWVDGRVYKKEI